VFDCGDDQVTTSWGRGFTDSAYSQVVGFGAAGNENDFIWASANQGSHLAPCPLNRGPGFLTLKVNAGRIAKLFSEVGHQSSYHPAIDRGCSAVV
jgi:hypothetical protein